MGIGDSVARTTFAIEVLLSGDARAKASLTRDMAGRWPDASALSLIFALTDAAARIEGEFSTRTESRDAAFSGYRMAAILAADIYALELAGHPAPVYGTDLLHYWDGDAA